MPNPIARAAETVAPARLGRSFRWLLASATLTNAGSGVSLAAGPLLVASQTRDPLLVSMAVLAQSLPALIFGFVSGAVADRFDRRRIIALVNVGRAFVMGVVAATIALGSVSIWLVLTALFVLGTAETFANVAGSSLLPRLVRREDLGIANARLQGAFVLVNQLVAPPIGALLFAIGMALPFATDAACFTLGAVLVGRIVDTVAAPSDAATRRWTGLASDIVEGLRWLRGNAPMRTLALTIFAFNITFGAAWSVLVLYAQERLGMDEVGFGLLTTAMAIGGLIGTASYGRLERRFSLADIMRVGLLIETFTHLVLAVSTNATVVLAAFVVFGGHAFVWGTTSTAVRQRAVPDALLGRVTSVYRTGGVLGIVIGTPIGGLLARQFGITAPFWFGFLGSALLVTLLWGEFDKIVHAGDVEPAGT